MSFLIPSSRITFEAALRDVSVAKAPKARAFAAHALGSVTDPTEKRMAVEALVLALDDDRLEVRAEAAASLGELGDTSILPHLIKRLDDGIPAVRQNAAIALGSLAHPDGFAPLVDKLATGPADLRYQAATSLAEIDPVRAYTVLVPALADKDPQVVSAVALSLGAIGDAGAIPALKDRLAHPDAAARFDVAYALADLRDPTGRGTLINALVDEHRAWDAVTALGNLADEGALGLALTTKKVPAEATVAAAGKVLLLAPTGAHAGAAKRVLLTAYKSRKTHIRSLALEQLGAFAQADIISKFDDRNLVAAIEAAIKIAQDDIVEGRR